jgi:DNA repair ATPase RecN
MSMQLLNEVAVLKASLAESAAALEAVRRELRGALESIGALLAEHKEDRRTLRKLDERMATFDALKDALHRDAREILGQVRDRIDPTKVQMPYPLKALGYTAAKQ